MGLTLNYYKGAITLFVLLLAANNIFFVYIEKRFATYAKGIEQKSLIQIINNLFFLHTKSARNKIYETTTRFTGVLVD